MRKLLATAALLFFAAVLFAAAPYHIGIVTGTVSQSEDDLRGAEALIAEYGAVSNGGIIRHVTYPDNFMDEQETTISIIRGLIDDPLIKAVIVNQGIPGTTEAFRQIKEQRPDVLCFVGVSQEEPYQIASVADLILVDDFVSRGYLMMKEAYELGCKNFIHISFPRHLAMEKVQRRIAIMKATCEELGMNFISLSAPDPTSDVGVAGAQQYILENTPEWIKQYGTDSAFFCTNAAHTDPLIRQVMAYGAYFIESELPSPLLGYPGALDLDLSAEAGDFNAILNKLESRVIELGGANRFGTWVYSFGYSVSAGLGQLAIDTIEAELAGKQPYPYNSIRSVRKALGKYTPGADWNGSYYIEPNTGVSYRNYVLVYQDTYIMGGRGYMHNTDLEIPEKYYYLTGKN